MRLRLLPLALIAALALVALAGVGTASARSCKDLRVSGGYLTNITVRGVSCSTGHSVAREHRRKRLRNGVRGRFNGRVNGFRCREGSRSSSGDQIAARVRCTRGDKRVTFVYTQFV